MQRLSFEATAVRLARLATLRGGTVGAADVEQDELLARDPATTSAAARMLASRTYVLSTRKTEPGRWFPLARLTFTRILNRDDGEMSEAWSGKQA